MENRTKKYINFIIFGTLFLFFCSFINAEETFNPILLDDVNISFPEKIFFDTDVIIPIEIFDIKDALIENNNISIEIGNSDNYNFDVHRKNLGKYDMVVNIPKTDISYVNLTVTVSDQEKIIEQTKRISISSKVSFEDFLDKVSARANNLFSFVKNNLESFLIGTLIFALFIVASRVNRS